MHMDFCYVLKCVISWTTSSHDRWHTDDSKCFYASVSGTHLPVTAVPQSSTDVCFCMWILPLDFQTQNSVSVLCRNKLKFGSIRPQHTCPPPFWQCEMIILLQSKWVASLHRTEVELSLWGTKTGHFLDAAAGSGFKIQRTDCSNDPDGNSGINEEVTAAGDQLLGDWEQAGDGSDTQTW